MKRMLIISIVLCSLVFSMSMTSAKTIIVDDDWSGADYDSIQNAINGSGEGDTIRIFSGYFNEHLNVNKTLSIVGNGSETVITCLSQYTIVTITGDNCLIENVTIRDAGKWRYGMVVIGPNLTVRKCHFTSLEHGIDFNGDSSNSTISYCSFINITRFGIEYQSNIENPSGQIFLSDCTFINVSVGVKLFDAKINFRIVDCDFNNISRGIKLTSFYSGNGIIEECSFVGPNTTNGTGIRVRNPCCIIRYCTFTQLEFGIYLKGHDGPHSHMISNNVFMNNNHGVYNDDWNSHFTNVFSCLFMNNNDSAFYNFIGEIRVWNSTFIENGDIYQYGGNNSETYFERLIYFRNETSRGNFWSDFPGTDTDNDGYGEGIYGPPFEGDNGTWYQAHHPRLFPFHTSSTSERDITLHYCGSTYIGNPLEGSKITFVVALNCLNETAYSIPISVYGKDGDDWDLLNSDISYNGNVRDGNIPMIPATDDPNATMIGINIEIPDGGVVAVVVNQFSRAIDSNGSFYWESDYENNEIIIEFEIIKKAKSNSTTAISDFGYLILAITSVLLTIIQRISYDR